MNTKILSRHKNNAGSINALNTANDNNLVATIVAMYLSKFDRKALEALSFLTFTDAFSVLSKK